MLHPGPGGELRGVHPAAGVSGVQAVAEQDKDTGKPEPQLSVLSVSQRWWHICVILLCAQTLGWMAFIRWGIHDSAGSYREIIEAMVYGTSRAIPLFIVFSMTVPLIAEFTGGLIVVLAEYLKRRFEKRGEKRGREQANSDWEAWYKRMKEAQEKGVSFDESPPSLKS